MTEFEAKEQKVRELSLKVGDIVICTNWIHKRIKIQILEQIFRTGLTANVIDLDSGQVATVGRNELITWLAQEDTEVVRQGFKGRK